MKRFVVAIALLAACRGGKPARKDAGPSGPALSVSVVPKLPLSPDGNAELASLDKSIELAADNARLRVPLLFQRAAIRGRLDDYVEALTLTAALVEQSPTEANAWDLRVQALLRVHDFAAARAALDKLRPLVHPSRLVDHEIALAEASGDADGAIVMRADLAKTFPSPANLTAWAAALAQAGLTDEAIAIIPRAAAAVRDNPAQLIAWLLFQWGRCYELKGEVGAARELYAAAHARMPLYVEATAHLVDTMIASRDLDGARKVVDDALAADRAWSTASAANAGSASTGRASKTGSASTGGAASKGSAAKAGSASTGGAASKGSAAKTGSASTGGAASTGSAAKTGSASTGSATAGSGSAAATHAHPTLLELGAVLGHGELVETARAEWERYVAALPLAFSDHAARFYLGAGQKPARALELARINFSNRPTAEARALVVEAALAAGELQAACADVGPLVSRGTRAQRFIAWKALSQCGRAAEANRLGRELGIH